jgi:non-heme chloroperoxidase
MAIAEREARQIKEANASGRPVVMFVHGLWLLSASWRRWQQLFEEAGYATMAPSWPNEPATVAEARADPEVFAGLTIGQVAWHVVELMTQLTGKRAVVGHSLGGLLAQIIAGHGFSQATVAIAPAPFRGVRRLPKSALRSAMPVLGNPANWGREVTLTFEQFRFGWANAVTDEEAWSLYREFHVAASGAALFQVALANLNPWSQASVDTKNRKRGPLLLISGSQDNTIPPAITNASFRLQRRNRGVTEIMEIPDRGHTLTIDSGWRDVADPVLEFIKRFL